MSVLPTHHSQTRAQSLSTHSLRGYMSTTNSSQLKKLEHMMIRFINKNNSLFERLEDDPRAASPMEMLETVRRFQSKVVSSFDSDKHVCRLMLSAGDETPCCVEHLAIGVRLSTDEHEIAVILFDVDDVRGGPHVRSLI